MTDAWDDAALALSPEAYWSFDDDGGGDILLTDLTGNGHDGSLIQAPTLGTLSNGMKGAHFNNANLDEIRVLDVHELRPEVWPALTVTAWVQQDLAGMDGSTRSIWSKMQTSGVPDSGVAMGTWTGNPTGAWARFGGGPGGGQSNPSDRFQTKSSGVSPVVLVEADTAIHLAFVLTFGVSGGIQWYLNGEPYPHNEYGNDSFTWGSGSTAFRNLRIGVTDFGSAWDGMVAKMGWWNTALTDEDIAAIYGAGPPPATFNLQLGLPL